MVIPAARSPRFGFEEGLVHAIHLAWIGNHRTAAECSTGGDGLFWAGELFQPSEIILYPDESLGIS